ncbi:MAG: hypothetical protein SGPRY_001795 [Prymnesium sp.]
MARSVGPRWAPEPRSTEDEAHLEHLVYKLAAGDRTPGRIAAPVCELREMAAAVTDARVQGVNPRTRGQEDLAWRQFTDFSSMRGFDPYLRTEWTRRFPERKSIKLSSFLLYPCRDLVLRRVFRRLDQQLPDTVSVRDTLKGMLRRFIALYGVESLRQQRVELVTLAIVRRMVTLADTGQARMPGRQGSLADWDCFIVTSWQVVNLSAGTRKAESVRLPEDDSDNWFARASETYRIRGRTLMDPTPSRICGLWRKATSYALHPKEQNATNMERATAPIRSIQALGRWMTPDSIRICARMTTTDYTSWVDRMMTIEHFDATRTTNLPVLDAADALALWGNDAESLSAAFTGGEKARSSGAHTLARPTTVIPQLRQLTQQRAAPAALPARRKRRPRCQSATMCPTVDQGSTTGVGRLDHAFCGRPLPIHNVLGPLPRSAQATEANPPAHARWGRCPAPRRPQRQTLLLTRAAAEPSRSASAVSRCEGHFSALQGLEMRAEHRNAPRQLTVENAPGGGVALEKPTTTTAEAPAPLSLQRGERATRRPQRLAFVVCEAYDFDVYGRCVECDTAWMSSGVICSGLMISSAGWSMACNGAARPTGFPQRTLSGGIACAAALFHDVEEHGLTLRSLLEFDVDARSHTLCYAVDVEAEAVKLTRLFHDVVCFGDDACIVVSSKTVVEAPVPQTERALRVCPQQALWLVADQAEVDTLIIWGSSKKWWRLAAGRR